MYVITGATGNTGRRIAEALLARGEQVRVVGRSRERLEPLVKKGAEAFVGDVTDATAMEQAFRGATAAYQVIPPSLGEEDFRGYQGRVAESFAAALGKAGVRHAVTLSSIGAHLPEKTGPILGLRRMEERLNRVAGLNVLHLRAAHFMENTLQVIPLIKNMGMAAGALRGDLSVPMIATRDISAVAVEALLRRDFTVHATRELLGQRDISWNEATRIIGAAIGKPKLGYMQAPYGQVQAALQQMGLSANGAQLIVEMYTSVNEGKLRAQEKRSAENTTPTTFEQFVAEEFVPRYKGQAARAN